MTGKGKRGEECDGRKKNGIGDRRRKRKRRKRKRRRSKRRKERSMAG